METGFIKLSRKLFDNKLWQATRTFSGCEAWIDLIQSARFDATPTMSSIGGCEVVYGRGQYPASIRFLAKKWQWSEKRVRFFLDALKRDGMITTDSSQGVNVITLINYDEYNDVGTPKGTGKGTPNDLKHNELQKETAHQMAQTRAHPTKEGHSKGTNKKKEKEKKPISKDIGKKDAAKAATLARKEEFYNSIKPFADRYPSELLSDFFGYWSEMNRSCTKMRFEQQTTWEVSRRLATWAKNEKKYENRRNYTNKQEANAYALERLMQHKRDIEDGMVGKVEVPF